MKPGRLLLAVILLAGLSAGLWWSNKQEKEKEGKPAPDAPPKIFAIQEDMVKRIDLKRKVGEATSVQFNDKGKWEITQPVALPAESTAIASLTSTAANLKADRVVDPNVTDLASYGLAPPLFEMDILTKDGKTSKLLIGETTPTGSNVYAKLDGDPRLFTIPAYNKATFDRVANDLRDKHLLEFTGGKIARVELTAKKQTAEFGKISDTEWQILKPKPMRADSVAVDDLVTKLKNSIMDVSATPDDLKKASAAYPSAPVFAAIKLTDSTGTQTLEFRKIKDDYFAQSSALKGVYKVAKDVAEPFDKSLADFRNKKVFDFGFNDPTKVVVTDNGKTNTYEKTGEKWVSTGKTMDSTGLQSFIDKLRDLSAVKFPESGFTTPVATITVISDAGKHTEKVELAQAAAGGNFIARRDGDSSLYELDANAVKELRQAASDIREAQPDKKK